MIYINISNEPAQTFDYSTNFAKYTFTLRETDYGMTVDISLNDVVTATRMPVLLNSPLIPYPQLKDSMDGNFLIIGDLSAKINCSEFNNTQFFIYLDQSELLEFKSNG